MMALVKSSSIQKHPLLWGWVWAGLTVALICLINYVRGQAMPHLAAALPIWAVAGAGWGYAMKWSFDRKERARHG